MPVDRWHSFSVRQRCRVTGTIQDKQRPRLHLGSQHGTRQDATGHRVCRCVPTSHRRPMHSHHCACQYTTELGGGVQHVAASVTVSRGGLLRHRRERPGAHSENCDKHVLAAIIPSSHIEREHENKRGTCKSCL